MATTEAVPFNQKSSVNKSVSQPLRTNVRQELVLHPVALKDRKPFAFLEQRSPLLCGEERSGQLISPA